MSRFRLKALVLLAAALAMTSVPDYAEARTRRRPTRRARKAPRRVVPPPVLVLPEGASARDRIVGDAMLRAIKGKDGAVVAMDPRSGRVIAVVNPRHAVAGAYTPCSVFKTVVAIGGLSEGLITPDSTHRCTGRGTCSKWAGHGVIGLRAALAHSCNPYFELIGEQLGYDRVQKYARLLGLGEQTGINLQGETSGVVPAWVQPTAVGHLSSHATGIATSPIQLAVLISATVNGGIIYRPRLAVENDFVPEERWRLPLDTRLDGLAEGFISAVNEGSAKSAFDPQVTVAGKTGTCEQLGWFASYAPASNPEIVVVVFLRYGSGHLASAVAGNVYHRLYPSTGAAGQ